MLFRGGGGFFGEVRFFLAGRGFVYGGRFGSAGRVFFWGKWWHIGATILWPSAISLTPLAIYF